jgi:hypothetical protein
MRLIILVHPVIVGNKSYGIFNFIQNLVNLKMLKNEVIDKNFIWLLYKIIK